MNRVATDQEYKKKEFLSRGLLVKKFIKLLQSTFRNATLFLKIFCISKNAEQDINFTQFQNILKNITKLNYENEIIFKGLVYCNKL